MIIGDILPAVITLHVFGSYPVIFNFRKLSPIVLQISVLLVDAIILSTIFPASHTCLFYDGYLSFFPNINSFAMCIAR